jgi:hypothetical protein
MTVSKLKWQFTAAINDVHSIAIRLKRIAFAIDFQRDTRL